MDQQDGTSVEALMEKSLLSAIINEPSVLNDVLEILLPRDFREPRHELIFEKIIDFQQKGIVPDLLGIANALSVEGRITSVGGVEYLMEMFTADRDYKVADPRNHALRIKEAALLRDLSSLSSEIHEKTRPGSGLTSDSLIEYANDRLYNISLQTNTSQIQRMGDLLESVVDAIEERSQLPEGLAQGIPSGLVDLDALTNGFRPGQMVIIAARPAMGKTTLALDICRAASMMAGKTSLFFSLEMGNSEVVEKVVSAHGKILFEHIKKGRLNNEEWTRMGRALADLKDAPFYIDDTAEMTMAQIKAACLKQAASPDGLDLVVIDYLQLVNMQGSAESRQVQVSEASRSIKLLAKELGVPVIVLSQLNRAVDSRPDKIPLVSDLRESGSLEQDADIIILVNRQEVYDKTVRPGEADLIIAKHRGGPTATVTVISMLEYSKFANYGGKYLSSEPAPQEGESLPPAEIITMDPDATDFSQIAENPFPNDAPFPEEEVATAW